MLKVLYSLAIALLVVFFVGFGISTFSQPPPVPPGCSEEALAVDCGHVQKETPQALREADQREEAYTEQLSDYNQLVSSISIGVAVVLLVGSILWLGGLAVIGDGVTLGAVFTLFYGLIRSFMTDSEVFRFVAVAVGLVVVIGLVYVRFVRPSSRGTGPPQGTEALGT